MTRFARSIDGTAYVGDDEGFVPLDSVAPGSTSVTDVLPAAAAGDISLAESTARRIPDDHLSFARPLEAFGKLWGIGLNYAEHATDLDETRPDEPASFMKPATAATGPGGPIRLPPTSQSERVTAEAELGLVIGRTCRGVSVEEAEDVIAGYVPIIDMTAEDILQRNPRYLTRAKSFDSFIVFGPWMASTDAVGDLEHIQVRTVVNETVEAKNTVENMLYDPLELVSFHSDVMTLQPGDVISTGTPGAHPIEDGDHVRAEVDGVGTVSADVVREE